MFTSVQESSESTPAPTPIREPSEPAPIQELSVFTSEPAPIQELSVSTSEPTPVQLFSESTAEPAKVQERSEPTPVCDSSESTHEQLSLLLPHEFTPELTPVYKFTLVYESAPEPAQSTSPLQSSFQSVPSLATRGHSLESLFVCFGLRFPSPFALIIVLLLPALYH